MPGTLVRIAGVSAFYPGLLPRKSILNNISLEVRSGCHLALAGPNGAGKSSLLKLIHGDLWPACGVIQWADGENFSASPIVARKLCGLVSPAIQAQCQGAGWQINGMDLLAGAESDAPYSFAGNATARDAIWQLMDELDARPLLALRLPEFSHGQLRLILLARQLLRKPALLLLDEWSEGLDWVKQKLVLAKLEAVARETTMIFASHRPEAIPGWVSEKLFMSNGALCQTGEIARKKTVAQICGHVRVPKNARRIFNLENVSVFIDSRPVLHELSWQMRAGEHWQICGSNGAGKSTFLRLLAGDEFVYAGGRMEFWREGKTTPVQTLAEKRRAISLVSDFGQARHDCNLTGLELILSGYHNTVGLYHQFSEKELKWAAELLEVFFPEDSREIATQSILRLSSGQLRRLFLCRAIVGKPEVLLLDEATSNLDVESECRFLELLGSLAGDGIYGIRPAIVLVTHQKAPAFINRKATLARGRLEIQN